MSTHRGRHAASPSLLGQLRDRVAAKRESAGSDASATSRWVKPAIGVAAAAALVAGGVATYQTVSPTVTEAAPAAIDAARDAAAASRAFNRLALDNIERVTITVTVDGETADHIVPALSLAEALAEAGVVVGPFDTVSEPLSATATDGMHVTIERGTEGTLSDETTTEPETVKKEDPNLPRGQERVETEGKAGISRTTYRVSTRAGEETDRITLATVVVQEPENRVILVGTGDPSKRPARPAPANPGPVGPVPTGSNQDIARGMLGSYGWGDDQFQCLNSLWQRESNWNHLAKNPSSGAYGIPQALPGSKMASAGADWQTNPATQIKWGLGYIKGRYGSPCAALNHSHARGWY
ncbi:MAG: G5 domain-containing protein [Bowdeniella nasicola]|nr:G5 domain-containing protein [Bowdeniella nasicola]